MVLSDFTPLQCAHIRTVAIQGKKTKNMPGMRRAAGAKKDQQHQYQWFDLFVFFLPPVWRCTACAESCKDGSACVAGVPL